MEFTQEYKQEVFQMLQYNPYIEDIMKAFEDKDPVRIRMYFEILLDELEVNLSPRIILDDGDRILWNSMVLRWFQLNKLYAEFMDQYTEELPEYEKEKNKAKSSQDA